MARGIVTLSQSNTLWTVINGNYDFITDQQTGQGQADIVGGTGSDAGFMTAFDNNGGNTSLTDGFLAFRVRMNARDGTAQNPDFSNYLWIGIEANGNDAIDGFLNFHGGQQGSVGIYSPGTGANTSPSTTTISNTAYVSYTTTA
ncbi:MAG TPA: hypothetical protein VFY13_04995, partial [Luteolibacter sp.]|nr:hypothetical protein [Luteolibacter sp.]